VIRYVAVLIALAGCDQLFNLDHIKEGTLPVDASDVTGDGKIDSPPPDAFVCLNPVGHDEDGDELDDNCDGCPTFYALTDGDNDQDGLPNVCDRDDAANHRDRIIAYWTFPTNDMTGLTKTGTSMHRSLNNGEWLIPNNSSLGTSAFYVLTRIDVHIAGMTLPTFSDEVDIQVGGMTVCRYRGTQCGSNPGTCLTNGGATAPWPQVPMNARLISLYQDGTDLVCDIRSSPTAPATTVSSSGGFTNGNVTIVANAGGGITVQSLVLYAQKP